MAELVPRFCVLGGGLPGLASAFFLQRSFPLAHITVLEKSKQCGGTILSRQGSHGQVLEQGFHSSILVNKNGREALGLARLLKLDDDVLSANIEASARRHLYHYGRVQLFPRVPHILRYCPPLVAEPLWPRTSAEDESVYDFVRRRSSTGIADRLADPLCQGQLAGDARQISVRTCFPRLWFNERRFRSVFMGSMLSVFSAHQQRSWLSLDLLDPLLQRIAAGGRCYSFQAGLGALTQRLEDQLREPPAGTRPAEILLEAEVAALVAPKAAAHKSAEVRLRNGRCVQADAVVSALPPWELALLLAASGLEVPGSSTGSRSMCEMLGKIQNTSVTVVSMSFSRDVFRGRFRGAGYFCGSLEKQDILGMSWDSQLFPKQNSRPDQARLTVYIKGRDAKAENVALQAVRGHLGVEDEPEEVLTTAWDQALPEYTVGHHRTMRELDSLRLKNLPWLQFVGPGYYGTRAVADEIVDARKLADALHRRFARFPGLIENEVLEDTALRYGSGFDAD